MLTNDHDGQLIRTPKSVVHGSDRLKCRSQSYNNILYYCDGVYITSLQVFDDPKWVVVRFNNTKEQKKQNKGRLRRER